MAEVAFAVLVRGVREQHPALVLGELGAREVPVGLARDQAGQFVVLAGSGGVPEPVRGIAHDQGRGLGDPSRVLDAEQLLLRAVDLAPEAGAAGAAAFSAGEEPVVDPGGRGGELDLPVHGVRGEEDERGAVVTGPLDGAAHGGRPVLVVAGEDQAAVAGGIDAAGVQVAGVGVGEVVAVALGPADEVVGVTDVQGQAGAGVGTVEGDGDRGVALAEQPSLLVPGVVEARARAAVLRVEVVGLPGDVGQQEQQIGRVVVPHREGDVRAVAVGGRQDRHVRADAPVRGDLEPPGQPPVVAGDGAVGCQGRGLDDAGEPRTGGDLGGAVAAVVPDAVHVDRELLRRVHGDVEVDGLTGRDGSGGGEPLDLPVHVVGGAGAAVAAGAGDLTGGDGRIHVPGHDLSAVVVVELAAPEPRQGTLSEGVGHRVRQRT